MHGLLLLQHILSLHFRSTRKKPILTPEEPSAVYQTFNDVDDKSPLRKFYSAGCTVPQDFGVTGSHKVNHLPKFLRISPTTDKN